MLSGVHVIDLGRFELGHILQFKDYGQVINKHGKFLNEFNLRAAL